MAQDIQALLTNVKEITESPTVLENLMNFERVLDHLNLYVFANWIDGELVEGPDVEKYWVSCKFMWPYSKMPDPSGGEKLLAYGCKVLYSIDSIKIPVKIETPNDYKPGTAYPKMVKKKIWIVEIEMPQKLIKDIARGSLDLENENIDMENIDSAIDKDIDDQIYQQEMTPEEEMPGGPGAGMPAEAPAPGAA